MFAQGDRSIAWQLLSSLFLAAPAFGLTIHSLEQSATEVGRYKPLTIRFGLSKSYANPYDPDLIDVAFEFTGHSGIKRVIPAFWSAEGSGWMIRIVPVELGWHTCRIVARDGTGETADALLSFMSTFSDDRGFVRIDPRNPRYLRFDNGEPYRPVGQNLCWSIADPIFMTYLDKMAAARQNWTRYWAVPFVNQGLEWGHTLEPEAQGLGRYSQTHSRRFDNALSAARDRGIRVQMCLDSFNGWNPSFLDNWSINPYNGANGGMLAWPIDYFTNAAARKYARQLFRYIVARWSYNTGVLAWELWNEVDAVGSPNATFFGNEQVVVDWHRDMARYIRSIDPYAHPITTSFADGGPRSSYTPFWQLPEMDIVQVHRYSLVHPADHLDLIRSVRQFGKCVIMGEGMIMPDNPSQADPGGGSIRVLHWAGAVEESSVMPWAWDTWIHAKNLYWNFTPVVRFLDNDDWAPHGLTTLDVTRLAGTGFEIYGSGGARHAYVFLRDYRSGVSGARLRLNQIGPGTYRVEFWNTGDGTVRGSTTLTTAGGGLTVDVPTFDWDIAFKVMPVAPAIALAPTVLQTSAILGAALPQQSFTIKNIGPVALNYEINVDVPWLTLSAYSGTSTGEVHTIHVNYQSALLGQGAYEGNITVSDASGMALPKRVAVSVIVQTHRLDFDRDGDVDHSDFGWFQSCLTGPGYAQADPACATAKLDADNDVDGADMILFLACLSGAGVTPNPACLP